MWSGWQHFRTVLDASHKDAEKDVMNVLTADTDRAGHRRLDTFAATWLGGCVGAVS